MLTPTSITGSSPPRPPCPIGRVLVDLCCDSYAAPPSAVTLDIDDTCDVVHGHRQLSLFHARHDERCFLPIHVYDTATCRPAPR